MTLKSHILAQIRAADTVRESIDGETIVYATVSYTGIVSTVNDIYMAQESGDSGKEKLSITMRIDQFIATPANFDPDVDYVADLPANKEIVTLRGKTWRIENHRTVFDTYIANITEVRLFT